MQHAHEELVECVRREITMRNKVYPRFVEQGRMTVDEMQREIECMSEVLDIVKKHKDRQIPLLTESAF